MNKISEGAEAYIYSTDFLGLDAIIKKRIIKKYRAKEIDENIRILRTRNEAKILSAVSNLGLKSSKLLLVDKYDIYMTKINGLMLNNLLSSGKKINNLSGMFVLLGNYLAILHNNNIVHGDYTPANVMIGKNGNLFVIDFGLSQITNSIEEKSLDVLLMKRSIDKKNIGIFIESYRNICKENKEVLKRLKEIEKRGRYNTRTILVN